MLRTMFAFALMLAMFSARPLHAQVQVDAAKITCDQFVHEKIAPTRLLAAWLSGFYNGRRGNSVLDPQSFQANLNKLQKYCYDEKNFKTPVMEAAENILGDRR